MLLKKFYNIAVFVLCVLAVYSAWLFRLEGDDPYYAVMCVISLLFVWFCYRHSKWLAKNDWMYPADNVLVK